MQSTRARVVQYPFDKYFDQQVRELENTAGVVVEHTVEEVTDKKDPFVSSDNGGPPPPPVPGLLKGMYSADLIVVDKCADDLSHSAASSCAGRGELR